MDFDLTDEQQLIRESAVKFADAEIAPRARDNDRNEKFDLEMVGKIADMGFLGAIIPEQYGGRDLNYASYSLIVEEIGRADSTARTVVSVQTSLVASTILKWGSEDQKKDLLPKLCSGEWLGCFGLTEPDVGSDAASVKTSATRKNGGWTLSGQKMFISLGCNARIALIFAQTDPEKKTRGLACFIVPTDRPGFSAKPIHGKLGLRASDTAELILDEVEVSDDDLLGDVGEGFKVAMSALDSGRFSVAAGCVGLAQGCVNESVKYSKEREQFGKPIASFQLIQEMIADMVVETDASRLLVWRAADVKDKGKRSTIETSIAKYYASETAIKCADKAIQIHGGYGYIDEYPVERYLRDSRVATLYEGTSQIQKLIIGYDATGVSAFN